SAFISLGFGARFRLLTERAPFSGCYSVTCHPLVGHWSPTNAWLYTDDQKGRSSVWAGNSVGIAPSGGRAFKPKLSISLRYSLTSGRECLVARAVSSGLRPICLQRRTRRRHCT